MADHQMTGAARYSRPSFGPPVVGATCPNIQSSFAICCTYMPARTAPPAANDHTHRYTSASLLGTNM